MSDIQTRSRTALGCSPEAATRQFADLVAVFTNRLEDDQDHRGRKLLSSRQAPSDAERAAMEERRATLRASLEPGDLRQMRPVVKALLAAFPTYGATADDANALAALTARALDDVPVWAVQEAAARFVKGRVRVLWSHDKAPTPPQIRGEAKHCMLPVEDELAKLSAVLDATLVDTDATDDERDAALAHWEKLKREIQGNNVVGSPENLQAVGLRETNQREKLKEHRRLAAQGLDIPVSADGLTVSTALRDSNLAYAREHGIRMTEEA